MAQLTVPVPTSRYAWSALAAVAVTVVAWASAFVAIRYIGRSFDPAPLALGRLVVGSAALGALVLAQRRWVPPTRREWALLLVCGVVWFGVYNVALNAAERLVDAGTTAMLVNIGPILIALFAGFLLGEGFPRWLVIGALVAFAGAVLIGAGTARAGDADVLGVALCVVAAVTYAIGVLVQKPVLRRLPAVQVTFLACTIGAVACLPAVPGLVGDLTTAPAQAVAGLVYLGLVPTALAFSTWAYALARMDAGRLGVTTYLVPPITIVLSVVLLGELPTVIAMLGGAVCLAGVALSRRHSRGALLAAESLARFAALLADRTRASMCLALLDGRAWTVGELARHAGVAASTASEHLTALVDAALLAQERQGRHRYVRLADEGVAQLVEDLVAVTGEPVRPNSLRTVRARAGLVAARTCYDHLAGRLGVALFDALVHRELLTVEQGAALTQAGLRWFADLGATLHSTSRRPVVRICLDWTERRSHLAGVAGAALHDELLARRWTTRAAGTRAVTVTPAGRRGLRELLGVDA